ncbi:hypothetical protein F52700_2489 [Fusarium sp. NRRL 52700]|nr:hypothetical protein F52700_2489 [Fusarium sp. NRRL 52700]
MSARQTRKRQMSDSGDLQRPKRGRLPNEYKNSRVPEDAVSRQTARTMLRDHRSLKVDRKDERGFYRDLIEKPIDNWSAEDEAAVVSDWNQSEAKSRSQNFTPQHTHLIRTWKISLRLYQKTPVTILSLYNSLRYQPVSTSNNAIEEIYSGTFCCELSKLMVHPCFEQKMTLLTTALGWTVICRLDDRRLWGLNRTYGCPALKILSKAIEECEGSRMRLSLHEMHETAREAAFEQRTEPSVFSTLLCNIGKAVSDEGDPRPPVDYKYQTVKGFDVLPVTLWDLRVLAKAVNSTKFRTEWNYSTEEAFMAWTAEHGITDAPEKAQLPLLYELAHLDLLRHYVTLRRQSESTNSRHHVAASEPQISEPLSSQGVIWDGDTDNPGRGSPIHQTSSPNEQGHDEMTGFLDGGLDSDGPIAAPLETDLSLTREATRPEITFTSMEDRPFCQQRRYKALVDGEETEDEQEDLQRNQSRQPNPRQRIVPDRQGTTLRQAAAIAVSAEVTESDLIRGLRSQVAQLIEENKKLSDKVKYLESRIPDLDVVHENTGREAGMKWVGEVDAKLREMAGSL